MNFKFKFSDYTSFFKHPAMGISIHNWVLLLNKHRFNIYIGFIPKASLITFFALFNSPFHLFEYLRFSSRIKKVKIKTPVFVLGHPRSGTTYLNNILSKDPVFSYSATYDVLTPHIFLTFKKGLKLMMSKAMPSTRPQDNMKLSINSPNEEEFAMANISQTSYMHGFFFPKDILQNFKESVVFNDTKFSNHWKKRYDFFLKKLAYKYTAQQLLLKSPANTGRLKEIAELYPDAKFIHIYRNPYDVYLSTERLYEKVLPITSFQQVDNKKMETYIIEAYALLYKKYLLDKKQLPKEQLFEIKYEDFVKNPVETIEKAYHQLGLKTFKEAEQLFKNEVNAEKDYVKNSYATVPPSIKKIINEKWKFAFDEFGYPIEN